MREYKEEEWCVFEFVPDIIIVHSGIHGGDPTIKNTRVCTYVAASSFLNFEWDDYHITERQAFAALCFEAGREYQRKRSKINKLVNESWGEYNEKHYPELPDSNPQ